MAKNRSAKYQILVHIGSIIPFLVLVWDFYNNDLTVNPIQEATLRTGKTALILLLLSLACTPANTVLGFRHALKIRRPLGLYAFFYASIHFLIFVGVDYGFNWNLIKNAIFEKRYALVGFSAFLIMLPMAITSTKGWKKRMGKKWKQLHNLVYIAGVLVTIHYLWLVKADIGKPLYYGMIFIILMTIRLPKIKKYFSTGKAAQIKSHLHF